MSNRKLIANPSFLTEAYKTFFRTNGLSIEYTPKVVKVGGVYHQSFEAPSGTDLTMTKSKNIHVGDFQKKDLIYKIETNDLYSPYKREQHYTRSFIDSKDTPNQKGFLDSFVKNHSLDSVESFTGFQTRMAISNNLEEYKYFLYQSQRKAYFFKFPNQTGVYGRHVEKLLTESVYGIELNDNKHIAHKLKEMARYENNSLEAKDCFNDFSTTLFEQSQIQAKQQKNIFNSLDIPKELEDWRDVLKESTDGDLLDIVRKGSFDNETIDNALRKNSNTKYKV